MRHLGVMKPEGGRLENTTITMYSNEEDVVEILNRTSMSREQRRQNGKPSKRPYFKDFLVNEFYHMEKRLHETGAMGAKFFPVAAAGLM